MIGEVAARVGSDLEKHGACHRGSWGTNRVLVAGRDRALRVRPRRDDRKCGICPCPAKFRQRHTAGFRAAWATGVIEQSASVMIPVVCADGQTRSYASYIFPIRDPHGELLAVAAAWSPQHERDVDIRPLD